MTRNSWIAFGAIVALFFGGLVYLSVKDSIDVSKFDSHTILGEVKEAGGVADHVFGAKDSKVILIEYGDYQCPGCGAAYQPIKTITEKYKDKLAFVFRNFPLTSIHPNAKAAAAAAEAAGLQGKYWEMHDILYENQKSWERSSTSERASSFESYAGQIGLNSSAFRKTLTEKGEIINQKINFDLALGKNKDNVTGTPTFVLNGKPVDQYVKDGKIVDKGTKDSDPIWADAEAFDKFLLQPAFKEAGITI